jgi:hypothetical protein
MKKVIATIATLLITLPVHAQVDPKAHEHCLKAADYKGCVETMNGGAVTTSNSLSQLRAAMKVLPSRLESTNLRDFTANTQQFRDALALVEESNLQLQSDKDILVRAKQISRMVDALQSAWSDRINNGTYYGRYGYKSYYCDVLSAGVSSFNLAAGRVAVYYNGVSKKMLFTNMEDCSPQEYQMIDAIRVDIEAALVDPAVIKAQKEKEKRESELARLAAWDRYLEENPTLKAWAKANPNAAKVAREKWEKEQAKKENQPGVPAGDLWKAFQN